MRFRADPDLHNCFKLFRNEPQYFFFFDAVAHPNLSVPPCFQIPRTEHGDRIPKSQSLRTQNHEPEPQPQQQQRQCPASRPDHSQRSHGARQRRRR